MANFHIIQNHLQKIECNTARGYQFEKVCKWFLENDPYYKQKFQKVWLWADWDEPERWASRDKGADLIARTIDGKIWAIQAKFYNQDYYVTKSDVDKLLSESSRAVVAHRLLIATTNKIGPNAAEVLAGQEKPVTRVLLDSLENSDLNWSLALKNKSNPPKKIYKPRSHQKKALTKIVKGFKTSYQGQVHMACGTGKTLIGLWLAQKLKAQYTLVLVPSLHLVSQLYKEWTKNAGAFKFNTIFVCSDHTVAADEQDLQPGEFGYPVTTSPTDLVKALQINTNLPTVVFATYHSSLVLKDACTLYPELIFDLVIADEAHRCTGKSNSDFTIITHKDFIRAQRKLYMTATPKIYSEHVKTKTQEYDIQIASMDDEKKFGPVFYQLLFSDAINQTLLCDYHVYIAPITDMTFQEYAEKGRFVSFDGSETDARTLATQIYAAKAIKKLGLKKIITFHNSVKAAKDFIGTFPKAVTLLQPDERPVLQYCNVITGEMPQSDRNKILKKFADTQTEGVSILGNVKCLSEGVDVPAIDGIVFVDPKGSETDIVQSMGRVMRPSENKIVGTILIPVFVDTNADHAAELEKSCFKKVWKIVRALRSHDEMLAEELDNIRLELGKRTYKAPAKLTKISIDIPIGINQSFAEAITYKLIENCARVSLALSHPEIAAQWHPTKNGDLKPNILVAGSKKKVWWKCSIADDHEWGASVQNRAGNGSGCPICSGQKVVLSNCLATTHPKLVVQWHPIKNGSLTPYNVTAGSGKKVWWKCSIADDHEWLAEIRSRKLLGCPVCSNRKIVLSNSLLITHPELAAQWHPTKNVLLLPTTVVAGSLRRVWWKCTVVVNHEWEATINDRAGKKSGCPQCWRKN